MYVTLYAAANPQIVLDSIKDAENAKLLFTTHYDFLEGTQFSVTCGVMADVPEHHRIRPQLLPGLRSGEDRTARLRRTGRQHGTHTVAPGRRRRNRGRVPV